MQELTRCNLPVLRGHALDTGTNTDINHASIDGIGNVNARLEARRTLTVESLHTRGDRDTGRDSSSTETR